MAVWKFFAGVVVAGLFSATALTAADPVLTLRRGPETLALTLEDLAALPQATIVTENEFVHGMVTYRGPLAREVIAELVLHSSDTLRFTAANGYYIDIPTEELERYDVILATEADGTPLSRRDKGPIWLMYPISAHAELLDPAYVERLIWQLVDIEAL